MEPIWERGKGTSLNSDSLAPKPLASSFYVRVPEAPSPHERSISVTSLLPSLGRLPNRAGGDEEFAFRDTIRVVEPHQPCRGAALGGARLDAAPDELEMINPMVSSRVEQWLDGSRLLVYGGQITSIPGIADRARQGQVIGRGRAAMLFGDDVVDGMQSPGHCLGNEAVLATFARPVTNEAAQGGGDVGRAHELIAHRCA